MRARIDYLLKQYFYNRSSREELDELFGIIRSARYDRELSDLIRKRYEALKREDPSACYVDEHGELTRFAEMEELPPANSPQQPAPSTSRKRVRRMYGVIATCAAMLMVGFFYGQRFVQSDAQSSVQVIKSVAPDEKKVILLSDGTKVWVNASSKLEYPQQFVKGQAREVTLHGEAYFEVERAAEWPFIVHTGDIKTKVLGTKFNIKAYPGLANVLVSVRSGRVQVLQQEQVVATLLQNQEVSVSHRVKSAISARPEKQLKNKIAGNWIQGYLEYEDEPITAIVADIERSYGIEIDWRNSVLADKLVTLSVPSDSKPDYILQVLSTLTDTEVRKEGENYIIF